MSTRSEPRQRDEVEDGRWGPTVRGGRHRRGRTVVVAVAAVLVVLLLFAVATALYASARIDRIAVEGLGDAPGVMNVLVIGSDSRAELTPEERRELSTGSAPGERTDTIFVLQVSGTDAAMLAFPRDLFVERCDGSRGRINAAVALGGPGCLVRTVTALSGIELDHLLQVDFLGFRDIVDAVGGVPLCLDRPIQDDDAGIDLPAGCQTLTGQQALGYVRVRKIDSDLERIARQQRFLGSLADRITSPSTLANPLTVWRTAGQVGDALTADEDLGVIELGQLAVGLRSLAAGEAATLTVPTEPATIGGAAVLLPAEGEASEVFARFRSGALLGAAAPEVRPADVEVRVLNGAGVEGLAGRTAEALEAAGFVVVGIGNAEPTDVTTIRHPPAQRAGAELLAQRIAEQTGVEPRLEPTDEVASVTLVLGADVAAR